MLARPGLRSGMFRRLLFLIGSLLACVCAVETVEAAPAAVTVTAPAMHFLYNAQQSSNDTRVRYYTNVLHAALERTRREYGDYEMQTASEMSESRMVAEMEQDETVINTMLLPLRRGLEQKLIPVKIPVDRGLLGFRVFLIRAEDQPRFDKVHTLADLAKLRIGVGADWVDNKILSDAGLTVVGGNSYDGLFQMLMANRFDAFSRGATEIVHECDARCADLPGLAIEKSLLLYYPIPVYYWFPKTADGQRRAARVRAGLSAMVADGTLQKLFLAEFGPQLARLDLKHRRIIRMPNSQLGTDDTLNNRALWYDPFGK